MKIWQTLMLVSCIACTQPEQKGETGQKRTYLTIHEANRLSKLPIKCMQKEYPNKLGQTLSSSEDLGSPKELHPAFYGCFDWHSSVHGHWMLIKLLKTFPEINARDTIFNLISSNISADNILKEVEYFSKETAFSFERTYGWAWLLKLSEELHTWDNQKAKILEANLQPLTNLIVKRFLDFLPKLNYPIRVGEHTNTAFGLCLAWDYAAATDNSELKERIDLKAKAFYLNDMSCPLTWEPSGYDFLSPCLEEADLMRRVLSENEFNKWISKFLPQLLSDDFELSPASVLDRTDGKLVHLDGLNFSRAWCLYGISSSLGNVEHLNKIADQHINYSLKGIRDGSYEGEHWLATFAIYALFEAK